MKVGAKSGGERIEFAECYRSPYGLWRGLFKWHHPLAGSLSSLVIILIFSRKFPMFLFPIISRFGITSVLGNDSVFWSEVVQPKVVTSSEGKC